MKRARLAALGLLLALASFGIAAAQATSNSSAPSPFTGRPYHADSFRMAGAKAAAPVKISLDRMDPDAILATRKANASGENKALKIGLGRKMPPSAKVRSKEVAWTRVAGGHAVQWEVTSPEAVALRVELAVRSVPPAIELRFAGSDDTSTVYGPFTQADILNGDATYWSPVLHGSSAILEAFVPEEADFEAVDLVLSRISHLFVSPADPRAASLAKSGFCEVNLMCLAATNAALANTGASVAAMSSTGAAAETAYCTGTLLNPIGGSFTPYFYSATHCLSTQSQANNLSTHWYYQTTGCTNTIRDPRYFQLAGGATLLYTNAGTDGLLVRLNATPSGVWFSGWDANTIGTGTAMTAVHHPQSDVTKVSLATMGGYVSLSSPAGSFIRSNWNSIATGVTEPGSSGSGIFTYNGTTGDYRLRGGLYGGPSSCTAPAGSLYDYYSRLDQVYPSISQYLNPPVSTFNLSVSRSGSGGGTVTSSPAGINCGATCSASFTSGTVVTLVAAPATGSVFAGWSGACTGTGSCTTTMSTSRSVVATFNAADDYPDVYTAAPPMGVNSSTAAMIGTAADADWFRVDFPGPGTWTIRTTGSTDTVGGVYWPTGATQVDFDDDTDSP
ncbi:MAG TPA: hypothetical protein VGD18_01895, partial [Thiobacillaceae bacterium]